MRHFNYRLVETFDNKTGTSNVSNVSIIAQNMEKCLLFNFLNIKFIDSYLFLNASLELLVANFAQSCSSSNFYKFFHTRSVVGDNPLLFSKGIFPFEWFDSLSKFDEKQLPPRDAFYSSSQKRL